MDLFPPDRLPLVPEVYLKAHKVNHPADSRFRTCARLLQALHREAAGWGIGTYTTASGRRRKMGHLVSVFDGAAGANFLNRDIQRLARRELAYREPGAMFEERRLYENLLSSTSLALNLLGPIKLDRNLAEAFVREALPDLAGRVCSVSFEHSPGRGDPTFTDDATAFDGFITLRLDDGRKAFIAIEIKYSESCGEPEPRMRERYDTLSTSSELFIDPDDPALTPPAEPEAQDVLELKQSGAALHAALKTLPQEQVDLIRLSFFDEDSHSTIAARTGLPIGTVKSRIRLAFGRLRTALEEIK